MEKIYGSQLNHLMSFDCERDILKMTDKEKEDLRSDIKKQAAYYMLSVSRAVEAKDYKTAKAILIYIADSCSCIDNPDKEVHYLMEVCCLHLAFIKKKEDEERAKQDKLKSDVVLKRTVDHPVYVMKYNKFSGEFECDQEKKAIINQKVLFYLSKLNAILFSYQNIENHHPIIAMFKTYGVAFILVIVFIVLLFMVVFTNIVENIIHDLDHTSNLAQIPIIVVGVLFIIPIIIIYFKQPLKKDSAFFQLKLGEEITKINELCVKNGESIKFCMPEGIEINVHVEKPFDRERGTDR